MSCEDERRLDGNKGEDNKRLLEMREIIANFAKREGSLISLLTYLLISALVTMKTSILYL